MTIEFNSDKIRDKKRTLLIIEDESELRYSITFVLKRQGFSVASLSCAEDALLYFEGNRSVSFDLIITDIQLPGLSGLEFIDQLKARGTDIPVLVITAYKGIEIVKALETRGVNFYLIKPFDSSQLIEKISLIINSSENS